MTSFCSLSILSLILQTRCYLADGFIEHWENTAVNNPDHPFAKKIVDMPKVVFTETLDESTWNNTVLAKGNLADEIAYLKKQNGKRHYCCWRRRFCFIANKRGAY
jgi:hypothetical protein